MGILGMGRVLGILQDTTKLHDPQPPFIHKLRLLTTCRCLLAPTCSSRYVNHQVQKEFGRLSFHRHIISPIPTSLSSTTKIIHITTAYTQTETIRTNTFRTLSRNCQIALFLVNAHTIEEVLKDQNLESDILEGLLDFPDDPLEQAYLSYKWVANQAIAGSRLGIFGPV